MCTGTRVRNTVTGETGTATCTPYSAWLHDRPITVVNVRYNKPLRGYSPQRDELTTTLAPICTHCGQIMIWHGGVYACGH